MEKTHQNIGEIMSKIIKYVCRNCQYEFETEIITQEEAKDRKLQLVPVKCPRCKSKLVEERR